MQLALRSFFLFLAPTPLKYPQKTYVACLQIELQSKNIFWKCIIWPEAHQGCQHISINILSLVLARVKSQGFTINSFGSTLTIKSSQAPSLERGFSAFCSAGGLMQWISINACERRDSTPTCIIYTEPASAKTCRSSRELIFKRGSGKRRQGERIRSDTQPLARPQGFRFRCQAFHGFSGERLLRVSQRAARAHIHRRGLGILLLSTQRWFRS